MPRDDDKLAADMPAIRYFKVVLKTVFVIGNLKLFDISVWSRIEDCFSTENHERK